jgi:AraC family transcriptional regulator
MEDKYEIKQKCGSKELPKMTVAYIRHIGPYKGTINYSRSIWNKLFSWAGPRGLLVVKILNR